MSLTFCTYEDRPKHWTALRLLIHSLARHAPGVPIRLYAPQDMAERMSHEIAPAGPFELRTLDRAALRGWSVKPFVLNDMLQRESGAVAWIDSDIIVAGDPRPLLGTVPPRTLLLAGEFTLAHHQGTEVRTRLMGLELGRSIPFSLNTCVLVMTGHHQPLIDAWCDQLNSDAYRASQDKLFVDRPLCYMSDQDVLAGLLGSRQFADVPLHVIESGRDIAHLVDGLGLTLAERLRGGLRVPVFVHAQAHPKPYLDDHGRPIHNDVSIYCAVACDYERTLPEVSAWCHPRSRLGRVLDMLLGRWPLMRDLPVASVREAQARLRLRSRLRYVKFPKFGRGG